MADLPQSSVSCSSVALLLYFVALLPGPDHNVLLQPEFPMLLKNYYTTLKFYVVFILIILLTCH